MADLHLSQRADADALLSDDPFALLVGMLLDQQVPIERAFSAPFDLAERLGATPDPATVAAYDPERLAAVFATPPALHRYPVAMAGRTQALAQAVVADYGGDTTRIWAEAADGKDLLKRLQALPGFGQQKAKIFVALLGKQCGLDLPGWREAAGDYALAGFRSVADITSPDTLLQVREYKRAMKASARAASATAGSGPGGDG